MRRVGVGVALFVLAVGPWLGLFDSSSPRGPSFYRPVVMHLIPTKTDAITARPAAFRLASGPCSCRTIEVKAKNVVRDAEVRSGDASVVNSSITYIAPGFDGFDDAEVEVDQDAEAFTGDAIAGQILSVAGVGGCTNILISATNDVSDAEVRSGDATAINRSIVMFDPSVDRSKVDVDVDQDADAQSGRAVAGQIIGARADGGPCGRVAIDAVNRVRDVDIRSGRSLADNQSFIGQCDGEDCLAALFELLEEVGSVRVCSESGCRYVTTEEFAAMLGLSPPEEKVKEPKVRKDRPGRHGSDDDEEASPSPSPDDGSTFENATETAVLAEPTPTPEPSPATDGSTQAAGGDPSSPST